MKKILFVILLLITSHSSFCQLKKLFTKTTNTWYEMDYNGNRISRINFDEGQKYEFYFDKSRNYGYIIVTEFYNNNKSKMELKAMKTRVVNDSKVYIFHSADNAFEITTQSGINSVQICSNVEKKCTSFYYE